MAFLEYFIKFALLNVCSFIGDFPFKRIKSLCFKSRLILKSFLLQCLQHLPVICPDEQLFVYVKSNLISSEATIVEHVHVSLPCLFARLQICLVVEPDEELALNEVTDGRSLPVISPQADRDELLKVSRPSASVDGRHIHLDDASVQFLPVSDLVEGGHACCKLVGEAAVGPDVDRLAVEDTVDDLRSDPIRRTLLR